MGTGTAAGRPGEASTEVEAGSDGVAEPAAVVGGEVPAQAGEASRPPTLEELQQQLGMVQGELDINDQQGLAQQQQLQQLQGNFFQFHQQAVTVEENRKARAAMLDEAASMLASVKSVLSTGSSEVGTQLLDAQELLSQAAESASAFGGGEELQRSQAALQMLSSVQESMDREDLFQARIDLALAIDHADVARNLARSFALPLFPGANGANNTTPGVPATGGQFGIPSFPGSGMNNRLPGSSATGGQP